jgi:hypothetical protein
MTIMRKLVIVAMVAMTLMVAACTNSTTQSTATTTSTTTTSTTPVSTASLGANCGPAFFSSTDQARVSSWFGRDELCLRWTHTWVVLVSSGMMKAESRGGAALLLDTCRAGATTCLQKETPHPLSDFRAYPLPDPAAVGAEVLARYPNNLWGVGDGRCGLILFDFETDHFYAGSEAVAELLQRHPDRALPPLSAPSFLANESPLPKASPLPSWCRAAG